jgi:signal transduction histidine kinase
MSRLPLWSQPGERLAQALRRPEFLLQLALVFVAYFLAGKLGQAPTNIRSSNLGPVWPAYGVALASFLAFGIRVWPAVAASAFAVALSSVPMAAAFGQSFGATVASATGMLLLRRFLDFDPHIRRLRDALGLIVVGAFGTALVSSCIGILSLYESGIQPYSGIGSAWLIYWLGDSTGVLLVTPLVFTAPSLLRLPSRWRYVELLALLTLLTGACFAIFGDLPFLPRLHVPLAMLIFVMWAAIDFGIAGAALSVLLAASLATVLTALGSGPFAQHPTVVSAALLDVLFAVLAISGLVLAALIAEAEDDRSRQRRVDEAALSMVKRKWIEAQEQERTRIARELHDDIGQRLALLTIKLTSRTLHLPEGTERAEAVELQKIASDLAEDVQKLSHGLHSSRVTNFGVATSMRQFCSEFSGQHGLAVHFEQYNVPSELRPDISLSLYRVLQEALHNGARHSRAQKLDVRLWATGRTMHLEVRDDGTGFDVKKARERPGIGLFTMEERMKLVDGELAIESMPSRGTTVRARVPLRH